MRWQVELMGLLRGSGESRAKRSATDPGGSWTLLAHEAEGPLGPPAGQAVGPDLL